MSTTNEFTEFVNTKIKEQGYTLEELAKVSGISLKHLEALVHGRFENLPAIPYLKGYLIKLAELLDFDAELLWKEVKRAENIHRSGSNDILPSNRFFRKSSPSRWIVLLIIVLIGVYFTARAPKIFGRPDLEINSPKESLIQTAEEHFTLEGTLENGELTINNEAISVRGDGTWQKEIMLQGGLNTFEFKAHKLLGRETVVIRQIFYTMPTTSSTTETGTPESTLE